MSRALAVASRPVALDLYALIRDLDARGARAAEEATRRLLELRDEASALVASWEDAETAVAEELRGLLETLGEGALSLRASASAMGESVAKNGDEAWTRLCDELRERYDALSEALRAEAVDVPERRSPNRARTAFHITSALVCLVLVEYVLAPWQMVVVAGIGAVWCWTMEIGRRFSADMNERLLRLFSAVSHPHERHTVNSATWYSTALVLMALLFTPRTCVVALVILGLADPAAAFVGRRWGRLRFKNGRSLEGTLTFVLVGAAAAFATLAIWHWSDLSSWKAAVAIAFGAALPAAVAELVTRKIDDNFAIPLAAGAGATLVSLVL